LKHPFLSTPSLVSLYVRRSIEASVYEIVRGIHSVRLSKMGSFLTHCHSGLLQTVYPTNAILELNLTVLADAMGSFLTHYYSISLQTAYPTNAILELNPTVLADADAKDAERAACAPNCGFNKLHGIPVLLKDNVCADGMECTAGDDSRTLHESMSREF
jgi:hypothetical protein